MIDIHNHILHEVDDGSSSIDLSIEMIKKQISDGVTKIILTPHMRSFKSEKISKVKKHFEELKNKVETLNLKVELYLGAEVYYTENTLEHKSELALANTNYVLVEFSTILDTSIEEAIYNLKTLKLKPIVAHIERYGYLSKKDIIDIKKTGGIIQVNSSAILGYDGFRRKRVAKFLLKKGLVDVVASDSHNLTDRKPNLKEAYHYVNLKHGKTYADLIFTDNPQKILDNKNL